MIERIVAPVAEDDLRQLAELLVDTVESGAAVSFLAPLPLQQAMQWWRETIESSPNAVFLVARDASGIAGTVQLHPSWAPNQPHRGDIAKLMVHRRARGAGLGRRLMERIEAEARRAGLTLLTLDTRQHSAAERLYRGLGWTEAGVIPDFAVDPDGVTPHATVIFYKRV